jgi:hypothetical protein
LSASCFSRPPNLQREEYVSIYTNGNHGHSERHKGLIFGGNVLPVVEITVSLGRLSAKVGQVASEEQVVSGCDSEGVAHECSGVNDKSTSHGAGDTVNEAISTQSLEQIIAAIYHRNNRDKRLSGIKGSKINIHLSILLRVHHSGDGDTEVRDGAPEV